MKTSNRRRKTERATNTAAALFDQRYGKLKRGRPPRLLHIGTEHTATITPTDKF